MRDRFSAVTAIVTLVKKIFKANFHLRLGSMMEISFSMLGNSTALLRLQFRFLIRAKHQYLI